MSSAASLVNAVGWFVAIALAIPLLLWLLKRSPMGPRLAGTPLGGMKQVSALALGAQQRMVTVEVGQGEERRWLVLGVAPGGVSLLYSLTPQEPPVPAAATASNTPAEGFQQLLQRLKNTGGGDRGR